MKPNTILNTHFILACSLFLGFPALAQVAPEPDIKTSCQLASYDTNNAVIFDGEFCRCSVGLTPINPNDPYVVKQCSAAAQARNACRAAPKGLTRFVGSYVLPFGYLNRCFCIPSGAYMDEFDSFDPDMQEMRKQALTNCETIQASLLKRPSYEVGQMIDYYLAGLPKNVSPLVDVNSLDSIFSFLDPKNASRTVKIVGKKTGRHGGVVYVYRKKWKAANWSDSSDPAGQQVDPRFSVVALGSVIGSFFGFEKIDDNTFTLPSLQEFRTALAKVNHDSMIVAGEALEVEGQFGTEDYLQKFIKEGLLPASDFLPNGDETYFFHDMALHLASILIFPPDFWKKLQRDAETLQTAYSRAVESLGQEAGEHIKKELKKYANEILVFVIDNVSVLPVFLLADPRISNLSEAEFSQLIASFGIFMHPDEAKQISFYMGNGISHEIQERTNIEAVKQLNTFGKDIQAFKVDERLSNSGVNCSSIYYKFTFSLREQMARLVSRIFAITHQCAANEIR